MYPQVMIDKLQYIFLKLIFSISVGCKAYPIIAINSISLIFFSLLKLSRYTLNHYSNVLL